MQSRAIELQPKLGWIIYEQCDSHPTRKRVVGQVPLDPAFEFHHPAVKLAMQISAIPDLVEIAQEAALAGDANARDVLMRLELMPESSPESGIDTTD